MSEKLKMCKCKDHQGENPISVSLFGKHSNTKDKKQIYCRDCMKQAQRKWMASKDNQKKHKKRVNDWNSRWLKENAEMIEDLTGRRYTSCRSGKAALLRIQEPEKHLLKTAKSNAKRVGVECNLILDDIHIPDMCPILNIPLYFTPGQATDNTPSIDRIIPSTSYNRDNILIMSMRANRIKNDGTPDEHFKIYEYFSRYK